MSDEKDGKKDPSKIRPSDLPDPSDLPHLNVYSHSTLMYWWPVWLTGYVMALFTYLNGKTIQLDKVRNEWFDPTSTLGVIYVAVLLFVIIFTNIKLRGILSIGFILGILLVGVTFALFGWWDTILEIIPQMSIHMNMGFYLFFSTALLIIWLLQFFVFDRMTYWRIQPGQLTEEHLISGGEETYDARGMLFEQHGDDFFRHRILGLGAGDLALTTSGAKQATIQIPNVLFAERKVRDIQKLVAVQPDKLMPHPEDEKKDDEGSKES